MRQHRHPYRHLLHRRRNHRPPMRTVLHAGPGATPPPSLEERKAALANHFNSILHNNASRMRCEHCWDYIAHNYAYAGVPNKAVNGTLDVKVDTVWSYGHATHKDKNPVKDTAYALQTKSNDPLKLLQVGDWVIAWNGNNAPDGKGLHSLQYMGNNSDGTPRFISSPDGARGVVADVILNNPDASHPLTIVRIMRDHRANIPGEAPVKSFAELGLDISKLPASLPKQEVDSVQRAFPKMVPDGLMGPETRLGLVAYVNGHHGALPPGLEPSFIPQVLAFVTPYLSKEATAKLHLDPTSIARPSIQSPAPMS